MFRCPSCTSYLVAQTPIVAQTHATGQLLREAGHINKSLHYLELVITTLAEKKIDVFVPYRNSMMTSVLRDRCFHLFSHLFRSCD
jgi:hypothetical protein